jgi:hypothetical protein
MKSRRSMNICLRTNPARGPALIGLLVIAGCAAGGNSSDNGKSGSFYGGVTGGRP